MLNNTVIKKSNVDSFNLFLRIPCMYNYDEVLTKL